MNECALCGKELKDKNYGTVWRTCWITTAASGITRYQVLKGHGFYEPRLTSDELWKIGSHGQYNICTDRQGCRRRQTGG